MAHWAELDENNVVLRVTVGDNNDPAGDEGYSWLIANLGGRWIKTSYNTVNGKHRLGGVPFRGHFAGEGFRYDEERDIFIPPKPKTSWSFNYETYSWEPPVPRPEGNFYWDEDSTSWIEVNQ